MGPQVIHPLTYATPPLRSVGQGAFRVGLVVWALAGIAANALFAAATLREVLLARAAHADLVTNPSAFGRLVPAAHIESLGRPWGLWSTSGMLASATGIGIVLAVHLLIAAWKMGGRHELGARYLQRYRRFKLWGVFLTATAIFLFDQESKAFWAVATRHHFVGELPSIIYPIVVAVFGFWTWRWVGRYRA